MKSHKDSEIFRTIMVYKKAGSKTFRLFNINLKQIFILLKSFS